MNFTILLISKPPLLVAHSHKSDITAKSRLTLHFGLIELNYGFKKNDDTTRLDKNSQIFVRDVQTPGKSTSVGMRLQ